MPGVRKSTYLCAADLSANTNSNGPSIAPDALAQVKKAFKGMMRRKKQNAPEQSAATHTSSSSTNQGSTTTEHGQAAAVAGKTPRRCRCRFRLLRVTC